jgi:putative restriction endonuclease
MIKKERGNWTEDELILAFNLYCNIPFGKIHNRNPEIIQLGKLIGRTPSSVSWKLANFARLDPELRKRNIAGASHGSKSEEDIWNRFNNNWEELIYQSEKLRAKYSNENIEDQIIDYIDNDSITGIEKERLVKIRINQNFFRTAVLASYNYKCAITGINIPELLNASHIIPWSKNNKERLNPRNGICMNTLHDRAFDRGLISIDEHYKIILSKKLIKMIDVESIKEYFSIYENKQIKLPEKFLPDKTFLKHHYDNIFQG